MCWYGLESQEKCEYMCWYVKCGWLVFVCKKLKFGKGEPNILAE